MKAINCPDAGRCNCQNKPPCCTNAHCVSHGNGCHLGCVSP